ncbi:MAG: hypothetical protein ACM3KD_11570 [Hyphomicrobiaceae bacterium]
MGVSIKTTEDGRKVEVIERSICVAGKREAVSLVPVSGRPKTPSPAHARP